MSPDGKGENMASHDLFGIDEALSEEARMTGKVLRSFLEQPNIVDTIRKCNIGEKPIPLSLMRELARMEIFGMNVDGYGCTKVGAATYGIAMRELERADSALRSFASVQNGLVMYPIAEFGSEDQKKYWLPRLKSSRAIGCFGLTESHGGSEPAAMRTTATPEKDGYVLNGEKMWITNGSIAHVAVIWAKTPEGIRGFLVPRKSPGFSATRIKNKWSLRASVTSVLAFENCFVPKESILPGTASGLKSALMCLNQARYGIAWGVVGAAEACYEAALAYAQKRVLFGAPIAQKQLIQRDLAEMALLISKTKLVASRLAELKDTNTLSFEQVSAAKLDNVRSAAMVAAKARNILGAAGLTYEMPIGAHLLNLETVRTYEGTEEIHTLILGKYITGFSAL